MTTQTVHLQTFDYGASLTSATLRALTTDSLVATADSTNEVTADSGLYAIVFDEASLIAAGTYRLRAIALGLPVTRYVTLAGTDGEIVQASLVPPTTAGAGDASQATLEDVQETVDSIAVALAGGSPVEPTGTTVFELLESINTRVSSISITTTGYAQLDAEGSLVLKRGHTATLTFTSTVSNKVSDLSASTTKVFFGIKDKSGRLWLQLEGTKLVNTGLQSVRFAIPKAIAAGLVAGVHLYDVVAIYGYNAGDYTSLEIFADGTVRVKELSLDLTALE